MFIWTKYFKNVRYSQQSQELDQNLHDNRIDFTESYRRINTHGMRELVNIWGNITPSALRVSVVKWGEALGTDRIELLTYRN